MRPTPPAVRRAPNLALRRTNLSIQAITRLDEYQTPLNFVQYNVPTVLDDTVLYLTTILGKTRDRKSVV